MVPWHHLPRNASLNPRLCIPCKARWPILFRESGILSLRIPDAIRARLCWLQRDPSIPQTGQTPQMRLSRETCALETPSRQQHLSIKHMANRRTNSTNLAYPNSMTHKVQQNCISQVFPTLTGELSVPLLPVTIGAPFCFVWHGSTTWCCSTVSDLVWPKTWYPLPLRTLQVSMAFATSPCLEWGLAQRWTSVPGLQHGHDGCCCVRGTQNCLCQNSTCAFCNKNPKNSCHKQTNSNFLLWSASCFSSLICYLKFPLLLSVECSKWVLLFSKVSSTSECRVHQQSATHGQVLCAGLVLIPLLHPYKCRASSSQLAKFVILSCLSVLSIWFANTLGIQPDTFSLWPIKHLSMTQLKHLKCLCELFQRGYETEVFEHEGFWWLQQSSSLLIFLLGKTEIHSSKFILNSPIHLISTVLRVQKQISLFSIHIPIPSFWKIGKRLFGPGGLALCCKA